jgi:hypothetical protein
VPVRRAASLQHHFTPLRSLPGGLGRARLRGDAVLHCESLHNQVHGGTTVWLSREQFL